MQYTLLSIIANVAAVAATAVSGTGTTYTNGTGVYRPTSTSSSTSTTIQLPDTTTLSDSTSSEITSPIIETTPSVGFPAPSQNATIPPGTGLTTTTTPVVSDTTTASAGVPFPSINGTTTAITTSGSSTDTTSTTASVGIPFPSSNGTTSIGTGVGGSTTTTDTTDTTTATTSTGASGGIPFPSANGTTTTSMGTGVGGTTTGIQTTSALSIGNTTIVPGGAPYVSGTKTYSLDSSGSLDVNGSPTSLPTSATPTSTDYPSGTYTSDPEVTSTMTTVPPGVSTQIITDQPSLTDNTWITTTGSDSSTTILPVIVPCPGCAPIIVWGVPPIPDVIFEWPKFPKLPEFHLPCIKIFGITISGDCPDPPSTDSEAPDPETPEDPEDPDDPESSTTSSTSSCTQTQTASDCSVLCKTVTSMVASSVTASETCSTTCFNTVSGCSVTGETTTTTTSSNSTTSATPACTVATPAGGSVEAWASGASACPSSCPASPAKRTVSALADAMPAKRTVVAISTVQQTAVRTIAKRAPASTILSLGNCPIGAATPAATPLTKPAYPGGIGFSQSDQNGQLAGASANVARWVTSTTVNCAPAMTTIDINAYAAANEGTPTMDHAFEVDWLQKFFSWLNGNKYGGPGLGCSDFNTIFFDNGNVNRLEAVFNSLASDVNVEDFVGMNDQFNQLYKGTVANQVLLKNTCSNVNGKNKKANPKMPNTQFPRFVTNVQQQMKALAQVYWGVQTINYGPVMDKIQTTYSRILDAFSDVDSNVQCNGGPDPGMAAYFQQYVTALMYEANYGISDTSAKCATSILQIISDNLNVMATWIGGDAGRQSTFDELVAQYDFYNKLGDPSSSSDLTWRIGFNAPSKKKRQDGGSCSLPSNPSDTATATSGSVPTTITSGGSTFVTMTRPVNSTTSVFSPYCWNYANPDENVDYCTCSDGSRYEPLTSGSAICPLSSPGPTSRLITTETPTTTSSAWTSTTTDPVGDVIACTSYSSLTIGVQGSVCVGSTISTFSPTPTPTPDPTAKFQIMFDLMEYEGLTGSAWYVYAKGYDETTEVCQDSIDVLDAPDIDPTRGDPIPFPDFPDGIDIRQDDVMGYKNCKYVGTSDAPGSLECDGLNAPCTEESYTGDQLGCTLLDGSTDTIYPKVICFFS